MSYKVAAIDIHKKVLMVVVASMADEVADATGAAVEFVQRRFGAGASERNQLVSWLQQQQVWEVVMESTAQYWKPIWLDLEPHFPKLHLAQAQSNRAPKGRKNDFQDAKRLARRLLADCAIHLATAGNCRTHGAGSGPRTHYAPADNRDPAVERIGRGGWIGPRILCRKRSPPLPSYKSSPAR